MPELPTFKDQSYPDNVGQGWLAMYAPAKTPADLPKAMTDDTLRGGRVGPAATAQGPGARDVAGLSHLNLAWHAPAVINAPPD